MKYQDGLYKLTFRQLLYENRQTLIKGLNFIISQFVCSLLILEGFSIGGGYGLIPLITALGLESIILWYFGCR